MGQRYWYVPSGTPTPPQLPAEYHPKSEPMIPGRPKPAIRATAGRCYYCDGPTPPAATKPRAYCSAACAQAATRDGQRQLRKILDRAYDPVSFQWTAIFLVLTDLTSRGYDVLFPTIGRFVDGIHATRADTLIVVRVYTDHVQFFDEDVGEGGIVQAFVRRTGSIQYRGLPDADDEAEEGEAEAEALVSVSDDEAEAEADDESGVGLVDDDPVS